VAVPPVVLVVEDHGAVREPLVRFLQMRQYAVIAAETAGEGLDAIRKNSIQAAIVDMRLREGSGRDVISALPAGVPVIICAGLRSDAADLERSRPYTRIVQKPFSLMSLMDTLEVLLAEANAEK